eukprot:1099100-Pelagomonas_calceolata.AAC.2
MKRIKYNRRFVNVAGLLPRALRESSSPPSDTFMPSLQTDMPPLVPAYPSAHDIMRPPPLLACTQLWASARRALTPSKHSSSMSTRAPEWLAAWSARSAA